MHVSQVVYIFANQPRPFLAKTGFPGNVETSLPTCLEAIEYLEDVHSFLKVNGHTTEATKTSDLGNDLAQLECSSSRYTVQLGIKSYILQTVHSMIIKLLIHHPIL